MKEKDAYMFPLIASASLYGIYILLKYLPQYWVNLAMKIYFGTIAILVVGSTVSQAILSFMPPQLHSYWQAKLFLFNFPRIHFPFISSRKEETGSPVENKPADVTVTRMDLFVGLPLGLVSSVLYGIHNHWMSTNIMGISFSIQAISLVNLNSFRIGFVILCGLFVYDIFWVFGTEVMVKVATKFDVPAKVLFPRNMGAESPAMLGLGDIVIPGMFIALMLRLDWHMEDPENNKKLQGKELTRTIPKSRRYFFGCLLSYIVGMSVTLWVMFSFKHAQPALLYLVPANLLSVILIALSRGELKILLTYSEDETKETIQEGTTTSASASSNRIKAE